MHTCHATASLAIRSIGKLLTIDSRAIGGAAITSTPCPLLLQVRVQLVEPIVTSAVCNDLQWELNCHSSYGLITVAAFAPYYSLQLLRSSSTAVVLLLVLPAGTGAGAAGAAAGANGAGAGTGAGAGGAVGGGGCCGSCGCCGCCCCCCCFGCCRRCRCCYSLRHGSVFRHKTRKPRDRNHQSNSDYKRA